MLEEINAARRVVQQGMSDDAEQAVAQAMAQSGGMLPMAVCLFDPDWHPGVIGLVASKMKDKMHRPVVALAPAEPEVQCCEGRHGRSQDCISAMYWWRSTVVIPG